MEDYAQDVYRKLLRNDSKALNNFKGLHENSIYTFIETIAIRIILNEFNINEVKMYDCDDTNNSIAARIGFNQWKNPFELYELKEEIEFCLEKILARSQKMQRDLYILKLYLYEDLEPKVITTKLKAAPSQKTISNVIANYKTPLRECLEQRLN
jgi:hypothetical protein